MGFISAAVAAENGLDPIRQSAPEGREPDSDDLLMIDLLGIEDRCQRIGQIVGADGLAGVR